MYYEYFKLIFHIECFLVPIRGGFLSWAMINGKKSKKKFLMAFILSTGILIVSFIGVYINSPAEIREDMRNNFEKSIMLEE